MLRIILLATLLAVAVVSKAETLIGSDGLYLIPAFGVEIYDYSENECWTNVESVKSAVQSILRQSDIEVIDDESSGGSTLQVKVLASRRAGVCYGAYVMSVEVLGVAYFLEDQTILGGMKLEETLSWFVDSPNGNQQILETAQNYAHAIVHKIRKQRSEND